MSTNNSGPSYFQVSKNKVSHSDQLADDVVVDYDKSGGIVGIEFLTAEAATQREKYMAMASRGSQARIVVPAPSTAIRAA